MVFKVFYECGLICVVYLVVHDWMLVKCIDLCWSLSTSVKFTLKDNGTGTVLLGYSRISLK